MVALIGALIASYIMPLAVYFFLRGAHKEDNEYKKDCRKLLLKGLLLGIPVFLFSLLCNIVFKFTHISDSYPFIEVIFRTFILMAFSEELMKYLLAKGTIKRNLSKVSFLDVMAFTTISAIGFELMEAVVYLFTSNVPQILVRGISNMHAAFGLIMGYILAKGIKKRGKLSVMPAVLVTTIIHGAYDLCLDESVIDTAWGNLALVLAILCFVLNIFNFFWMSKSRKKTYFTDPLFPEVSGTADINSDHANRQCGE